MSKRKLSVLAIMAASVAIACSDSVAPPKASTIEINSASDQQGFAGDFAAENPEVLALDANGQPVQGVTVKFAVTAGDGSVSNATTLSGPQGRATAGAWTLGPSLGVNTVVGSIDGVGSVQFKAEAVPVPSGTFQLTTVDGFPLPFTTVVGFDTVLGGTFTLTAARAFSFAEQIRDSDGAVIEGNVSGAFTAKSPKGLSFFSNGFEVLEGTLEGDTLTVGIWDLDDNIHSFVFVREASR